MIFGGYLMRKAAELGKYIPLLYNHSYWRLDQRGRVRTFTAAFDRGSWPSIRFRSTKELKSVRCSFSTAKLYSPRDTHWVSRYDNRSKRTLTLCWHASQTGRCRSVEPTWKYTWCDNVVPLHIHMSRWHRRQSSAQYLRRGDEIPWRQTTIRIWTTSYQRNWQQVG